LGLMIWIGMCWSEQILIKMKLVIFLFTKLGFFDYGFVFLNPILKFTKLFTEY
jgi:hypothetical protein